MNEKDYKAFIAELTGVMSFYRIDLTKFTATMWWNICKRFSLEQVKKAFQVHVQDPEQGVFAPKPANIVKILEGTTTDKSITAWSKVFEAMGAVGSYRDVVFDDPAIHATIEDMGGWVKLCITELDEMSYTQHTFCKTYQTYSNRNDYPFPPLLVGSSDSAERYKAFGLEKDAPSFVGDVKKCEEVRRLGSATVGRVHLVSNLIPETLKLSNEGAA